MAHPQNTPRGFFSIKRLDVGGMAQTYNSTALILSGGIRLNDKAAGVITANSTAIILPASGIQMAALTSLKITSNSTGIKIGTKYISCNSTGNATT